MKDGLMDIFLEMLSNAKSRKFLLAVAGMALVVANRHFALDLSIWELVVAIAPAAVFVIVEGIADILERDNNSLG